MQGNVRKNLRIAIVSLRGVEQAVARQEFLKRQDLEVIAKVKTGFAQISEIITASTTSFPKGRIEVSSYSPMGMRFRDLTELSDTKPFLVVAHDLHKPKPAPEIKVETSNIDGRSPYDEQEVKQAETDAKFTRQIEELQSFKSQLPSKVSSAGFTTARMPILATMKMLDSKKLARTGLDFVPLPGSFLFKNPAVMGSKSLRDMPTVIFKNQLVVGIENNLLKDTKAIKTLIERVNQRVGMHTNVLENPTKEGYIRSPGNPLSWIWLMEDRAVTQGAVKIMTAEFPWLSKESFVNKKARTEQESRELKSLEEQQQILLKRNMDLDKNALTRISELKQKQAEFKPEETQDEKNKRLVIQKQELQDRINKKFSKDLMEIKLIKEEIDDLKDKDDPASKKKMRGLGQQIKAIEDKIEKAKPDLIRDIKGKTK